MFELGDDYMITLNLGDDGVSEEITRYYHCKVLEYKHPVLRVEHNNREWTINTSSSHFILAELDRPRK
jgi:hypothetical protein